MLVSESRLLASYSQEFLEQKIQTLKSNLKSSLKTNEPPNNNQKL